MNANEPFSGSCLCGSVKYTFDAEPRVTVTCHCSRCRKATGSAFATWTLVAKERFRWTHGADDISEFQSSDHAQPFFCKHCGTPLRNLSARRPEFMIVATGTLDGAPSLRIAFHVHVASKAPWYEIADPLPQFSEEPARPR
jgi:hypothetical protein